MSQETECRTIHELTAIYVKQRTLINENTYAHAIIYINTYKRTRGDVERYSGQPVNTFFGEVKRTISIILTLLAQKLL